MRPVIIRSGLNPSGDNARSLYFGRYHVLDTLREINPQSSEDARGVAVATCPASVRSSLVCWGASEDDNSIFRSPCVTIMRVGYLSCVNCIL